MIPRLILILSTLIALSACVPSTGTTGFPENQMTGTCYQGYHAFDLDVALPRSYGPVLAVTQFSETAGNLTPVCTLNAADLDGGPTAFPIYSGEVASGRTGLCVSARTELQGHVYSCASQAAVARAVDAPLGSAGATIRLNRWQSFPEG